MKINNTTLSGVRPGKGFRDELASPAPLKDFVTNESRLENGKRVMYGSPRLASRTFNLEFQITGSSKAQYKQNLDAFYAELYKGEITLEASEFHELWHVVNNVNTPMVFHLTYMGKTPTYSSGLSGCASKIKVSFEEPNPANR